MKTIADLGPTKLLPAEQDQLREAADALFFCESLDDEAAIEAVGASHATVEHLVATERWTVERAAELVRDLEACGPAGVMV
jgi:hypothetical protein